MKSYRLGRLAGGMLVILLGTFSLSMAATNVYHLLKKYSFGAAEGSTREYFDYITVDSAAPRLSFPRHGNQDHRLRQRRPHHQHCRSEANSRGGLGQRVWQGLYQRRG